MIDPQKQTEFLAELDRELASASDAGATAMGLIAREFKHYNWVGIYWLEGDTLTLGPYVGAATEHTRIAVGQGVCGTAVAENRNQVIRDVRELSNYLACSVSTRSEIVVLIRDARGNILGQIDADGHELGAFDASDERLLSAVAERLAASR